MEVGAPDGAFGYVLKDSTDQQVVDAAKAVRRLLDTSANSKNRQAHNRCRALNLSFRRGLINRAELADWEEQPWS